MNSDGAIRYSIYEVSHSGLLKWVGLRIPPLSPPLDFAIAHKSRVANGNHFIFGLPLIPENELLIVEVIIGTAFDHTRYAVETSYGIIKTGTVSSAGPDSVRLDPFNVEVHSSGFADRWKGIEIRAIGEHPIEYVMVAMTYPFYSPYGHSTFLIHPNNELDGVNAQYEYFGESTDYDGLSIENNRKSNILLVGNFDATTVSITPTQSVRLPVDIQTNSRLVDVFPGTTHSIILHRLQTLLISSRSDLTSTRILSSRPLTVLTGHQCAQVPATHGYCEPMYIHIPPTFNWGQNFLLAPFAGRTVSQTYRLIASRNFTTIVYRCGSFEAERVHIRTAGSGYILRIPTASFCYLIATSPIFVVQVASGYLVDRLGDPAISIVSPFTGYVNSTIFFTSGSFSNRFISITVQANHFDETHIRLNGHQLSCNWTGVHNINSDNSVGYGCISEISAGTHKVSHRGGKLSVITYGWNSGPASGYAYLTAINLEPHSGGKCVQYCIVSICCYTPHKVVIVRPRIFKINRALG